MKRTVKNSEGTQKSSWSPLFFTCLSFYVYEAKGGQGWMHKAVKKGATSEILIKEMTLLLFQVDSTWSHHKVLWFTGYVSK